MMKEILIPVSPGELIDRMTILAIKSERIAEPAKLEGISAALSRLLMRAGEVFGPEDQEKIWPLYERLKAANEAIWDAEEELRQIDFEGDAEVAALCRTAERGNESRFHIKRQIDAFMNSALVEEKSYL